MSDTTWTDRWARAGVATQVGVAAAYVGGPVFLVGTVLHPPRDGHSIAEMGERYGPTHSIQAVGLLLLCVALANFLAESRHSSRRWIPSVNAALFGTIAWLGLIVYDGAHNPATALHAPEVVHTAGSLDTGAALIAGPALILFPLGYTLFGLALFGEGHRWPAALLGAGAVTYTIGGLLILPLGPLSPLIQPLEVVGAFSFAVGYILVAHALGASQTERSPASSPEGRPLEDW